MKLSLHAQDELLKQLKARFDQNMPRHLSMIWSNIQEKLEGNLQKLWSLSEMERTGGEPDVVDYDVATDEYIFFDCSPESPAERRSTCYDYQGLVSRKSNRPDHSAIELAQTMGIEILDEQQYHYLQTLGEFDLKTSSWLKTPDAIRKHGGAIFGDRRYNHVFVYHNGAQSYYASRGFRGMLRV